MASALVAGCSVAGSSALRIGEPSACTSDLGAYYLPKHHVTIALKRKPTNGAWIGKDGRPAYELAKFAGGRLANDGSANGKGRSIKVGVQPDPEFGFCLDYVAVPTTKDRLIVDRDAKTGLLVRVATRGKFYEDPSTAGDLGSPAIEPQETASENKSDYIAKRIIQATFTGLARRPARTCDDDKAYCDCVKLAGNDRDKRLACARTHLGYGVSSRAPADGTVFQSKHRGDFDDLTEDEKEKLADALERKIEDDAIDVAFNFDFDPTDPIEAATMNRELATYGYCAFLGDGKVEVQRAAEYCRDPLGYVSKRGFRPRPTRTSAGAEGHPFRPYNGGVLYRARVSYPFYVFKRELKRDGSDDWQLYEQEQVELANRGPIVSVGIDRAFFATRNTVLRFTEGTLNKIDIDRGSELKAFAGIPLALVTSIVKLPGQVLLVKIDQTTDTKDLIATNKAIIDSQIQYNEVLAALNRAEAAPRSGTGADLDPDRRSKLLNACESVLTTRGGAANRSVETCRQIVDQSYIR